MILVGLGCTALHKGPSSEAQATDTGFVFRYQARIPKHYIAGTQGQRTSLPPGRV